MSATNADAIDGTVYISDNLPFLRALDSDSIDLVCIDPPFGKTQTFTGTIRPPLSPEERRIEREALESWQVFDAASAYERGLEFPDQQGTTAKFEDIWSFRTRVYEGWLSHLKQADRPAWSAVELTRQTHSDSMGAYIAFMLERMLEVRRILKPTGSVWLHCDHTGLAYLTHMMDVVFGHQHMQNLISWPRYAVHSLSAGIDNTTDFLLFYGMPVAKVHPARNRTLTQEQIDERFPHLEEPTGRRFQHVALEQSSNRASAGEERIIGDRRVVSEIGWRWTQETFDHRLAQNPRLIYWTRNGRPRYKIYADEFEGVPLGSHWADIPYLASGDGERTGYPTQKPQALARRIIELCTDPGDLVLDCFAGCAYVPVAAQITGRRWIACDMSVRAWTIVRRQFHKHPELRIATEGDIASDKHGLKAEPALNTATRIIKVRGPNELPTRSDSAPPQPSAIPSRPVAQFRQRPRETSQQIWQAFVDEWGPICWYCGTEKVADRRELHLDHIEPSRRDGTNDDCWNRAIACAICNSNKRDTYSPEQTIDLAHEQGIFQTQALRDEALRRFKARHDWARLRWEDVRRQNPD